MNNVKIALMLADSTKGLLLNYNFGFHIGIFQSHWVRKILGKDFFNFQG